MEKFAMRKLILSLDGGGIRGAATTQFLALVDSELQARYRTTLRDQVDLFAGMSTGSIIALALATTRLSMKEIDALYDVEMAEKIFEENKGLFEIDGVNAPKYEASGKTEILKQKLGPETKIGDVKDGKHVLVVTYSVEKRKPIVIKSTKNNHVNLNAYQIADASSAAPTYFPTIEVDIAPDALDGTHWLIDGGVIANNPTMCALSEARRVWRDTKLDDFRVLSVGTGRMTRKVNGRASRKWGSAGWFAQGQILDILTDESIVGYQAGNMLADGTYIRVNSELKEQPGLAVAPDDSMDDVGQGNIRKLRALGEFWFSRYGAAAVELLVDQYVGPSLDRIDPILGNPIEVVGAQKTQPMPEVGRYRGIDPRPDADDIER